MKSVFKLREQLDFYFFNDKHNGRLCKTFHKLYYEKQIVKFRDSAKGISDIFPVFLLFLNYTI